MQIRFLNIFAQRISSSTTSKSTCVNIRTTQVSLSVNQQETKSDYYSEEFSKGRTSSYNQCNKKTTSDSSDLLTIQKESSENHRMPVCAAVIAHRHIFPAGGASTCAGSSKRSSFATGGGGASLRLTNALNILPPPIFSTSAIKKTSSSSKYSGTSGHFTGSSSAATTSGAVVGGGVIINGKGHRGPFVELKQLGYFLNNKVPSSAVLQESRRHYAKGKDKPKTKKSNVVINENEMAEVIDVESFKKQLNKVVEQMKEEFTTQLSIRGASGTHTRVLVHIFTNQID